MNTEISKDKRKHLEAGGNFIEKSRFILEG